MLTFATPTYALHKMSDLLLFSHILRTFICDTAVGQQLQAYEAEVFGSDGLLSTMFPTETGVGFRFGFPATAPTVNPLAFFNTSAFAPSSGNLLSFGSSSVSVMPPSDFVFGASRQEQEVGSGNITAMDSTMDSS